MKKRASSANSKGQPAIQNEKDFTQFINGYRTYMLQEKEDGQIFLFGDMAIELVKNISKYENLEAEKEPEETPKEEKTEEKLFIEQVFHLNSWSSKSYALKGIIDSEHLSNVHKLVQKHVVLNKIYAFNPGNGESCTPTIAILSVSEDLFFNDAKIELLKSNVMNLLEMTSVNHKATLTFGITVLKEHDSTKKDEELSDRIAQLKKMWDGDLAGEFLENLGEIKNLASLESYEEYRSKREYEHVGNSEVKHPLEKLFKAGLYEIFSNIEPKHPLSIDSLERLNDKEDYIFKYAMMHLTKIAKIIKQSLLEANDVFDSETPDTILDAELAKFTLEGQKFEKPFFHSGYRPTFSSLKQLWPLDLLKYIRKSYQKSQEDTNFFVQSREKENWKKNGDSPEITQSKVFYTHLHYMPEPIRIMYSMRTLISKKDLPIDKIENYLVHYVIALHILISKIITPGFIFTEEIEHSTKAYSDIFSDFGSHVEQAIKKATLQIDPEAVDYSRLRKDSPIFEYLKAYPDEEECVHKIANLYSEMDSYYRPEKDAVEYFLKSLAIDPKQPALYSQIGDLLLSMKKYEEALAFFRVTENIEKIECCMSSVDDTNEPIFGKKSALEVKIIRLDKKIMFGDIWMKLCQFEKALKCYLEADEMANTHTDGFRPDEGTRKIIAEKIVAASNKEPCDKRILQKYKAMLEAGEFYDYDLVDLKYFKDLLGAEQPSMEG